MINTSILISIIIPSYNYGRYLDEAIQSCLSQSYKNIEIIIIDDGSTDNTREIAEEYRGKVKYIYQDNLGPPATRNRGILEAQGEYICFLDADDKLHQQYLSDCFAVMKKVGQETGYVYTGVEFFGDVKKIISGKEYDLDVLKRENYINASALFRASVLKQYKFDERLKSGLEDWDLFLRLAENGIYGRLVDKPLLKYRKHTSESLSISDKIDDELRINKMQLRVQFRHFWFIGLGIVMHSLARVVRLSMGIKR